MHPIFILLGNNNLVRIIRPNGYCVPNILEVFYIDASFNLHDFHFKHNDHPYFINEA